MDVFNLSWNARIKILQAICFIGGPLVIIFNFNLLYLFLAWLFSYLSVHIGVSLGLHRCFSHRSWIPKHKITLVILHFLSLINIVGSSITWTGTHRLHHKHADSEKDPHGVAGKTFFTKIKYWFNFWPSHPIDIKVVRDLINDPMHKFFHRNYFKILFSYIAILLVIDVNLFLYGFVVATMFSLHTISWITVGAHIFGKQADFKADTSKNTFLMGTYMWGEGWHNNHHAKPWSYEFGWNKYQPDLGKHVIRLLAEPSSLRGKDVTR